MKLTPDALYQTLRCDLAEWVDPETDQLDWPVDSSTKQVAAYQLAKHFVSKFEADSSEAAEACALNKFLASNKRCESWELVLETSWDEVLVNTLKRVLDNFYHVDGMPLVGSHLHVFSEGRTGPGANVGALGESLYTKLFSSKLTSSSHLLYELYRDYTRDRELFERAEMARELSFGPVCVVRGSRLAFVPKKVDCSRTINIEATLNTYYQLGLESIMRRRLKSFFGIDLELQPVLNRELARLGSQEDELITLDLSEASNSIAFNMLKEFLPPGFFQWLKLGRHETVILPSGEELVLHMMSSMGNGYTFPLETAIFAAVVVSCAQARGVKIRLPRQGHLTSDSFGVFGDDIICNRKIAGDVKRLLMLLGFRINEDKSFVQGPFRESCGGDFFKGSPVRPVFCKKLARPQDRYSLLNRLIAWCATTGVMLPATVSLLQSSVKFRPVPPWDNEEAGLRVPLSLLEKRTPIKRFHGTLGYLRYVPVSEPIELGHRRIVIPDVLKRKYRALIRNPAGLLLAFLQGSIKDGQLVVRTRHQFYRTRACTAPNWDIRPAYEPCETGIRRIREDPVEFVFTRWETLCHLLLT
jgi:hypothetical protein